jgi:hypothetical protein
MHEHMIDGTAQFRFLRIGKARALRLWLANARSIPPLLKAQLNHLRRRLVISLGMILA